MRFEVHGIRRGTGEKVAITVEAPDERAAGWAILQRGVDVLSITPIGVPGTGVPRPVPAPVKPPNPRTQKMGRIMLIVSSVLFLVVLAFLIPSQIEYARMSERVDLKQRLPHMNSQELEQRYSYSGRAGQYEDYRNLADAERHQAGLFPALCTLWAVGVVSLILVFVAVSMRPFEGTTPT